MDILDQTERPIVLEDVRVEEFETNRCTAAEFKQWLKPRFD
jgi:hypothetical protein